jgi:radical SAM protein with 4Fe4S-binding SPASM domain
MSYQTACEIIEVYKPSKIIFFGGEPLLHLDTIQQIVSRYEHLTFQIITSFTVNTKEFIEFYKEYPIKQLQVSWDGFNTTNRISKSGKPLDQVVYNNMQLLIKNNIHFDVKCVISEDNVKNMLDIHKRFNIWRPQGIYGQFVFAHRTEYTEEYFEILRRDLIQTFDVNNLYGEHANRLLAYYYNDKCNCGSCDAGKYVVFNGNKEFSYCTALMYTDMEQDIQDLQTPCKHHKCKSCTYNYMCDGGCRYERYQVFKEEWQDHVLSSTCEFMKIYHDTIRQFIIDMPQTKKITLYQNLMKHKNFLTRMKG